VRKNPRQVAQLERSNEGVLIKHKAQCSLELSKIEAELSASSEPYPELKEEKKWESTENKPRQTEKLSKGVEIVRDNSLVFYKVQPGDGRIKIREKLAKLKEFAYLKKLPIDEKLKILSFNIKNENLHPRMLIPIPKAIEEREISDEDFTNQAHKAIVELAKNKTYGCQIKKLIKEKGETELIKTMLAVAKVESGGKPIGHFAYHRYEPAYNTYSFSIFHILMDGAGLKARKKLNLTEGQLYNPKNASKLFLAFVIEKAQGMKKSPSSLFPLIGTPEELNQAKTALRISPEKATERWPKTIQKFSDFYNGTGWRDRNQIYAHRLTKYYLQAEKTLKESSIGQTKTEIEFKNKIKEINGVKTIPIRRNEQIYDTIKNANKLHLSPPLHGRQIIKTAIKIENYLKETYGRPTYYPNDRVGISQDEQGTFAIFTRGTKSSERLRL